MTAITMVVAVINTIGESLGTQNPTQRDTNSPASATTIAVIQAAWLTNKLL